MNSRNSRRSGVLKNEIASTSASSTDTELTIPTRVIGVRVGQDHGEWARRERLNERPKLRETGSGIDEKRARAGPSGDQDGDDEEHEA